VPAAAPLAETGGAAAEPEPPPPGTVHQWSVPRVFALRDDRRTGVPAVVWADSGRGTGHRAFRAEPVAFPTA